MRRQGFLVGSAAITACAVASAVLAAEDAELDTVVVTAKRANLVSKGATGLPLEIKDTPQSISTITTDEMNDFGLTGSNEALSLATGVNVDLWETNRASFNARGFEIQLTQMDGLGISNSYGVALGREDTFLFDRIELIRGANGLLTGVGNSSGTVNYVRKRLKNEDEGSASVTAGSWGLKRVALDYNKVLTADGAWAARLVVAPEQQAHQPLWRGRWPDRQQWRAHARRHGRRCQTGFPHVGLADPDALRWFAGRLPRGLLHLAGLDLLEQQIHQRLCRVHPSPG
jgi:outer membrane receptor for ferric coprogen and ferric-rhodotorulic acid